MTEMDHPFRHATCDMSGLFTSPHAHQQAPQPAAAKHRWTDEARWTSERGCNDVSVAMECHPTSPWSDSDSFLSPTIQVLRSPCNLVDTGATQRGSVCVCSTILFSGTVGCRAKLDRRDQITSMAVNMCSYLPLISTQKMGLSSLWHMALVIIVIIINIIILS